MRRVDGFLDLIADVWDKAAGFLFGFCGFETRTIGR